MSSRDNGEQTPFIANPTSNPAAIDAMPMPQTDAPAAATKLEPYSDTEGAVPGHGIHQHGSGDPAMQTDSATTTIPSYGQSTLQVTGEAASHEDADLYQPYDNGYHFPPKYAFKDSFRQSMVSFWNFFTTIFGFLVVLYALNVVAWGGMIFLLLVNAAPAMCYGGCDYIDSPRRIWVEITAQILTALFSVTGFGLAPWRFRDMFWLLKWRLTKDHVALRRLAGIHNGWFRLAGSDNLPLDIGPDNLPETVSRDVIPFPEKKTPAPPLTGERAPPTPTWKLDFILWMNVSNTFAQAALSGIMWGMNRYDRPSWATGFLVAIACIVGAIGGIYMAMVGNGVKAVEGVPLTDEDKEKLARDKEHGIYHYNNIKAKKPKEKKKDEEKAARRTRSEKK